MEKYIKGNYTRKIFSSDKGFVIGLCKVRDTNDPSLESYINKTVTFTGSFPALNIDDTYIFYGEAIRHPKFGFQYNVKNYERVKPEDKDGVIEFLSSDLFPGVGIKLATRIVETLGLEALDLITKDEKVLNDIPKLSKKKANYIYNVLLEYEESHNLIVYLSDLGFPIKESILIYNVYKSKIKEIIESNIYQIIGNVDNVNFKKVDEIALSNGINELNPNRIKAVIYYSLTNLIYKNGDTYQQYNDIVTETEKYLNCSISGDYYDEYLYLLEKEEKIVKEDDAYYLKEMYDAEMNIAIRVINLVNKPIKKDKRIEKYFEHLESNAGIVYNSKQKEAIISSLENKVLIITGGPGTGKTTIIKAIVELYIQLEKLVGNKIDERIALLAPTGRASKRMSEGAKLQASTIHRFLKWNKETDKFSVDEYNKATQRLVIIDEASMIDVNLLDNLFKGLVKDARIIIVGDYNQLPSVGPGQVLKDLIESEVIDTIHLDLLYRQKEDSYINKLALEIKDNELSENFIEPKSDYMFLPCSKESLKDNLKTICTQVYNKGYDYKRLQVMAPMYFGENGIDNLNVVLQRIFNPPSRIKKEIYYGSVIYRENDKVLQLVNQPEDNVYNGDIGIISKIIDARNSESGRQEIVIKFDESEVTYTQSNFNKFKHGFVISIHKAQGSETEMVIVPICSSYKRMLYRKLLYTAVTRAKKKLIIIGEPTSFIDCVSNNNEYIRKTSLKNKILNLLYNTK